MIPDDVAAERRRPTTLVARPARRRDPGRDRRHRRRRATSAASPRRAIDVADTLGDAAAAVHRRACSCCPSCCCSSCSARVARAAEGRHHEPAVDRRGLRRGRGGLPVGMAGATLLGIERHRPDRAVRADDAVRDRVRPLDGLRGVPALAHPRGVRPHRRQRPRGGRRPRRDGARHHRGRGDHGLRVRAASCSATCRVLKLFGLGLAVGDLHRRHHRPHGARARDDGAARRRPTGGSRSGSSGCPSSTWRPTTTWRKSSSPCRSVARKRTRPPSPPAECDSGPGPGPHCSP